MDAPEAVRFVALHFVDSFKDMFDEDTYDSAKILIQNTPKDKIIKKIAKFLEPFSKEAENGRLTKEFLIQKGYIQKESTISSSDIESMGQQASIAYSLCTAIEAMDKTKLKEIETLASTIQAGIESQIGTMSEDERENCNPVELITNAMTNMSGNGDDIANVVGSLLNTVAPSKGTDKEALMKSFSNIDGVVAKKRR